MYRWLWRVKRALERRLDEGTRLVRQKTHGVRVIGRNSLERVGIDSTFAEWRAGAGLEPGSASSFRSLAIESVRGTAGSASQPVRLEMRLETCDGWRWLGITSFTSPS